MRTRNDLGRFLNRRGLVGLGVEVGVARGGFSRVILDVWRGKKHYLVDCWSPQDRFDYQDIHNVDQAKHEQNLLHLQTHLKPHDGRFEIARAFSRATDTFFDHRGDVAAVFSPGGQVSKSVYDGAGRVTTQYTTDGGAVNNSNTQQKDWTHAGSVSSDVVLTQTEMTYDADGNTILTTTRDRFHDDATSSEGGLGTPTSGIHARVSYMASYFDLANRLTDEVNVGTNAGSAYTRPSTVPSSSDTVLVTHDDYNSAGQVHIVTDPRGIYTESFFDMLGRTLETINNSTLGSPADGSQVTDWTYDGAGHVITMKAEFPGTATNSQTTQYVYSKPSTAARV